MTRLPRWTPLLLLVFALPTHAGRAIAEEPKANPPAEKSSAKSASSRKAPAKPVPAKRAARWANYKLVAKAFEHTSLARCTSFAPDGATFATGGSDRALRVWDSATGKILAVHQLPRSG